MTTPKMDDGTVILAVVEDDNTNLCLLGRYIPNSMGISVADYIKNLSHRFKFDNDGLAIATRKSSKSGIDFLFDTFQIIDPDGVVPAPSVNEIRQVIHNLSVQYSGKTFTDADFSNIVHQEVLNSPDDNRNQDEVYEDACSALIFFFLYGMIKEVFGNTQHGNVVMVYNSTEAAKEALQ